MSQNPASSSMPETAPLPAVRKVSLRDPVEWLKAGWRDLVATHFLGLFYGVCFVLMGLLIMWVYRTQWQFTMWMTTGFFLIGPFVCTGLYELSRQREREEPISLLQSMVCWKRNLGNVAFFATMLTFLMVFWLRASFLLFALASNTQFPTFRNLLSQIFSLDNLVFIIIWFGFGFVFASVAFAISVVSIPLMLDRGTDVMRSVIASARALLANPAPMLLWGLIIAIIIGLSLVLGLAPLVLTGPIIGHATWHAYRALLGE